MIDQASGLPVVSKHDDIIDKSSKESDVSPVFVVNTLPTSSVWCHGTERDNRVCRFRNLCYHPEYDHWFILKTNRSVLHNVPADRRPDALLDSGSISDHPFFYWNFVEASPFAPAMQNLPVRFEEMPHFMFKRLHPRNIMHNLHDDVIGMYYILKEYIGQSDAKHSMPFPLDGHRIMIIDSHRTEISDSTRPIQYLSNLPLRFKSYLRRDSERGVVTCFRDAVVGNSKIATFYQYGFRSPQGPIANKTVNGLHIREVAEWFARRLALRLGWDEDYNYPHRYPLPPSIAHDADQRSLDLQETDLVVVLARLSNRLILNEAEMVQRLSQTYGYETVVVRNEELTFEQQVMYMRRARIVIAMHGSILFMVMFCRRGTVVVEMFPFAVPSKDYTPYKTLAMLAGMDMIYRAWENTHENMSVPHPEHESLLGGINHLPIDQQNLIKSTHTVPPHKCCTNPYWLYRIYQDTRVTLSELLQVIDDGLSESRSLLKQLRSNVWFDQASVAATAPRKIQCLDHETRPPGALWISWEGPWNGAQVDQWLVQIQTNGTEFITRGAEPSMALPHFKPGETVSFFVTSVTNGERNDAWSARHECVV
eukprot:jgi/Hompol1/6481/HPOL_005013-RA